jgi:hypothetical protein
MIVRITFALSALYLAAIGLALMFFPLQFGVGAVPADASPELIALLRLLGGPFLGIAVLNWLSRDTAPSPALRAALLANIVGFGAVALNDVWGVATGQARDIAALFMVIHLAFTLAFLIAARASRQAGRRVVTRRRPHRASLHVRPGHGQLTGREGRRPSSESGKHA